jgi:hypothetical protein
VSAPREPVAIRRMIVTFNRDDVEVSITYSHDHEPATPGSKKRTTTAAGMARKGLERALEGLDTAEVVWGGFATDTHLTTDMVVLDRKKRAAA